MTLTKKELRERWGVKTGDIVKVRWYDDPSWYEGEVKYDRESKDYYILTNRYNEDTKDFHVLTEKGLYGNLSFADDVIMVKKHKLKKVI